MTPPTGPTRDEAAAYLAAGFWGTDSLGDYVRRWSTSKPDGLAFAGDDRRITWAEYDRLSTDLALVLIDSDLRPGDRVASFFPDSPETHVAWLGCEKAGLIAVGIGPRAGDKETRHLLDQTGARAIVSGSSVDDRPVAEIVDEAGRAIRHLVMDDLGQGDRWLPVGTGEGPPADPAALASIEQRRLGPDATFMLNSTSGTTGLPKCVVHTQNRWAYFHQLAVEAGDLTSEDVFCSAIPAPFGFGLWTAHFTPTYLGAPTHLRRRFDPAAFLKLLASEHVTVLAAVTTQLIMMLNSAELDRVDLSALRVVFTGGEAVPYEKAAEFEERTGAKVLQFYGSNETGAVSRTTLRDDRQHRLTTAGRVIEAMDVHLVDPATGDRVRGPAGQPACRGPATCQGYWNDPVGNSQLYTKDGWMLMGDLVNIDEDGYLTVVGRTSDIIIRGGKNISASAVEAEVMTHPSVAMAAAVAVPDPVFGERVCVFVQLRPQRTITLAELSGHLDERGVTREWFPEYLEIATELPRSSGGKVAKATLRQEALRLIGDKRQ